MRRTHTPRPGLPDVRYGEEPSMEHRKQADRLEREAERMERESERVGGHIEESRAEWEAKEEDSSVPGAQPEPGEEEEPTPGVESDPKRMREQGGP
jgi:hypothetical protein